MQLDIDSFLNLSQLNHLDSIELCEILWLAKYLKNNKKLYQPTIDIKTNNKIKEHKLSTNRQQKQKDKDINNQLKQEINYITQDNNKNISLKIDNNRTKNKMHVNIHHKGYFENRNKLSKYLINFKEKIPSKKKKLFDEEKTVNFIAKTNIKLPFYKPKMEKKFYLYLFIDTGNTMQVWSDMINVYKKLLLNSGVFKDTKIIYFNTSKTKVKFYQNKKETIQFNTKQITNTSNNNLILVVSDMNSLSWKKGNTLKYFVNLHKIAPLFIVQVLPYRIWRTTLLKQANITTLKPIKNYPTFKNYISNIDYILEQINSQNIKLPLVNFELFYLSKIGNILKGKNSIDGAIFDTIDAKIETETINTNPKQIVDNFFANASSKARELAISLSAIQIFNLPIMRMIQEKVLNETSNLYIAEILNSKLVVKNGNFFEFYKNQYGDTGEILLKLLGREKALEIIYKNSDYIQENLNTKFSFKALITGEEDLNNFETESNYKVFASIACKILKYLNKDIANRAGCFEKKEEHIEAIIPNSKRFILDSKGNKEIVFNYDFEISKYPVTVEEFTKFIEDTGYITDAEKGLGSFVWDKEKGWHQNININWKNIKPFFRQEPNHPVVCVSYNDAIEYCKWLSNKTGEIFRLPTKEEWQYACSGGNTTFWSFGDNENSLVKYAWYKENSNNSTHPVGKKLPNNFNLYDMHGHVSEWCLSENEIGILCGGNWSDKAQYTNVTSIKTTHQLLKNYSSERKYKTTLLNEKYRKNKHLSYLNIKWYIFKEDSSYQWGFRLLKEIKNTKIIKISKKNRFKQELSYIKDILESSGVDKVLEYLNNKNYSDDYKYNIFKSLEEEYKKDYKRYDISYDIIGDNHTKLAMLFESILKYDDTEKHYKYALNIAQELYSKYPVIHTINYIIALNNLSSFYKKTNKLNEALELSLESLKLIRKLNFESLIQTNTMEILSECYKNLGEIYQLLNENKKALQNFKEYNNIIKELYNRNPKQENYKSKLATSYKKLGNIYQSLGDAEKALQNFEYEKTLYEELYQDNQTQKSFKNSLAICYEKIANLYKDFNKYNIAINYYKKSNNLFIELYNKNKYDINFKNALAVSYEKLAEIFELTNNLNKAEKYYKNSIKLIDELIQENPNKFHFKNRISTIYRKLGYVYKNQNKLKEAENLFAKTLKIREEVLGENHPDTATTYTNLAMTYFSQGNFIKAEEYYLKALKIYKEVLGHNHPSTIAIYHNLAKLFETQKEYDEKKEYYKKIKEYLEKILLSEFKKKKLCEIVGKEVQIIDKYLSMDLGKSSPINNCGDVKDIKITRINSILNNYYQIEVVFEVNTFVDNIYGTDFILLNIEATIDFELINTEINNLNVDIIEINSI